MMHALIQYIVCNLIMFVYVIYKYYNTQALELVTLLLQWKCRLVWKPIRGQTGLSGNLNCYWAPFVLHMPQGMDEMMTSQEMTRLDELLAHSIRLLACSTLKHTDSPVIVTNWVVRRQHLTMETCWFAKRQATLASWLHDNVATEAQQARQWWVSLNACNCISSSGPGDTCFWQLEESGLGFVSSFLQFDSQAAVQHVQRQARCAYQPWAENLTGIPDFPLPRS